MDAATVCNTSQITICTYIPSLRPWRIAHRRALCKRLIPLSEMTTMRPLFLWYQNHVGYGHSIVLFAIIFCCLYGCAVSGGGKTPKDLNERNIAVLVLARDFDPYSWRGAERAFTPLANREADGLEWNCCRKWRV